MPESQVYAVYMNFKKSGKFKTQEELDALKAKNEEKYGHQMNISDMWPEKLIKNMDKTNKMEHFEPVFGENCPTDKEENSNDI